MRSYIKIYGPPIYKAIRALEKIAFDFPDVTIMDTIIEYGFPDQVIDEDGIISYFNFQGLDVTSKRKMKIISKSGARTGDSDFYYEWGVYPTMDQLNTLIMKIDEALTPLGCKYTITTRR
jgi:hypothetical protein